MAHGQYGFADTSLPRKLTHRLIGNGGNLAFFHECRRLMGEFQNETAGHRPANADRQPALLARAAILRSRPSSPSPCGSRPYGSRSGAGRYGRSPCGDRRQSLRPCHAARVSRRRCARIPFPLPSTPPFRLPASHPAARGDAPFGRSSRKPALRAYGFHRYAAEPPFFSLPRAIPRLLLGACDGGSEGDGKVGQGVASPVHDGSGPGRTGLLCRPRYRTAFRCSGSPKRIGFWSRKQ